MRNLARALVGVAAAAAALGGAGVAAPSPSPSPSPAATPGLTVTCEFTPLYAWPSGNDQPRRAPDGLARLGQRFGLISTRTTLGGSVFYETDIPVVELGGGTHYYLARTCANAD